MPRRFNLKQRLGHVRVSYTVRDNFTDTLAAGSVDGTPATPGPGSRKVTDVGAGISIGSGVAAFASGTGTWGETALAWNTAIARPTGYASGIVVEFDVVADVDKDIWVGLCSDASPGNFTAANCIHAVVFANDGNLDIIEAGTNRKANAAAVVNGTTYRVRFILYSAGCFYSISGGAFGTLGATYTALMEVTTSVTSPLYASVSNYNAVTTIDNVTIPKKVKSTTFANYVTDIPLAEAQELRNFFRLTTGEGWTNHTNWLSTADAESWQGITVGGGRTTHIVGTGNNLVGSISTWNFNLFTSLLQFQVDSNLNLTGSVAAWVLPANITIFYLSTSGLTGDIGHFVLPATLVTLSLQMSVAITGNIGSWVLPAAMTYINVQANPGAGVTGNISGWSLPAGLTQMRLNSTGVSGNIGSWTLPAALIIMDIKNTSVSGDISGWSFPAGFILLDIGATSVSGDISGWTFPNTMTELDLNSTSVSGNISGWTLPTGLVVLQLQSSSVTGSLSGWVFPANAAYVYLFSTTCSGAPQLTSNTKMALYIVRDMGLNQAGVDAIITTIFNRRASFTAAAPALQIGGTNAAPSGIYQHADPPTTGKEMIHDLINDTSAEGFHKWTVSYTA